VALRSAHINDLPGGKHRFRPETPQNGVADRRIAVRLLLMTLPLSPILRTQPTALPLTRPLSVLPVESDEAMFTYWEDLRELYHHALVESKLTRLIVSNRAARDDLLGQLLAEPVDSTTGVPIHVPNAFVDGSSRYRRDQRNLSKPMRMLAGVIRHDLEGADLEAVTRFLGHADHGWTGPDGTRHERGGPCRSAPKDFVAARRALHHLGAWPYAHATDGRLPADWYGRPEFAHPLEEWHAAAERGLKAYLDRVAL
jgi:hypothetical protein